MRIIHIEEDNLPMAWEKAVLRTWNEGDEFSTQYDKPGDPKSKDVFAVIHIKNPLSNPRIHRAFPGGLDDLEKYRSEVLHGVHDHWVNPSEGKWEYTYHERLFEYDIVEKKEDIEYGEFSGTYSAVAKKINQIDECIRMLKECGHTRRAQAVTWKCWEDLNISDPSCLQRLWFRVQDGKLNMVIHIRSNDAFKASFMNMYAFTELQAMVAEAVGVEVGEYIHVADSFHIYGSYFEEFEGFLKTVEQREPEDRVYTKEFAKDFFIDGCNVLLGEEDMPADKRKLVEERKEYLNSLE
jgi:thymidylate synthase